MAHPVRAKKHLGQHFLRDEHVIQKTFHAIEALNPSFVIEVGPGDGALSERLLNAFSEILLYDVDRESIAHLKQRFPEHTEKIIEQDFLKAMLPSKCAVVGNFPYNISSQIVFKIIEDRGKVEAMVGMFQKEVAERICAGPGSKTYGILSVLTQAYFETEYLFTVDEKSFDPPPKVKSGVMRMKRNATEVLACDERQFFSIVKRSFNQRRKMIRKSLKDLINETNSESIERYLTLRPEQLSVDDFIALTNALAPTK